MIRAGIDFRLSGDADKPGMVVAVVLNIGFQDFQPVQRRAGSGGDGRCVLPAALGNHLCRGCGIPADVHLPSAVRFQESGALLNRLLMGIDLTDIPDPGSRCRHQGMVNLHPGGTDNIEVPADHLVVNTVDRPCQTVLNRQDPVSAQSLFNRAEHAFKILAVQDGRRGKDLLAGLLGIRAFHALAGDYRPGRKQLRRFRQGGPDLLPEGAFGAAVQHLRGPALGHQEAEERPDSVSVFFAGPVPDAVQQIPFPFRVQHRQSVLPLIPADFPDQLHPFAVQADQFVVHLVNPCPNLLHIHFSSSRLYIRTLQTFGSRARKCSSSSSVGT